MEICDGSDTLRVDGGQAESRTPDVKFEHVLGDSVASSKVEKATRSSRTGGIGLICVSNS